MEENKYNQKMKTIVFKYDSIIYFFEDEKLKNGYKFSKFKCLPFRRENSCYFRCQLK